MMLIDDDGLVDADRQFQSGGRSLNFNKDDDDKKQSKTFWLF